MRLFTLRGPVIRMPWPLVLAGWAGVRGWQLLRWLAAHGVVTVAMLVVAALWWLAAHGGALFLVLTAGAVLMGWGWAMEARPRWYVQAVQAVASWRRLRWYERQWQAAMEGAGLTRGDDLPIPVAHRFGGAAGERDLDVLTVRMLPGQVVSDWRVQSIRLAAAFGLQRLRCHPLPGRPGDVQLFGRRYGLTPAAAERWRERTLLHPTVQPTVQPPQPSTAVDGPVDGTPRGAFPRQPRGDR